MSLSASYAAEKDGQGSERTILAFGKIKPYKGIDLLIEAFAGLPETLRAGAKLRIVGEPFSTGYQGIMFRKDDAALREPVTQHLAAMIADGSYKAILDKYGLGANAVPKPMLNAATQ